MKVFIYRSGKTFGPYSIDQLNGYLREGKVLRSDLACHDGKEWIKLSDVPGIFNPATKPVSLKKSLPLKTTQVGRNEKHPIPKSKDKKMPWKILLFAGVSAMMITALGLGFYFFSGNSQDESLGNTEFVHVIDSKLGKLDPWPAAQKIDDFLFDRLEKENLQPNPTITDEQFVRRIYLSIIGRIPTIPEANDFLNSDSNNKHSLLAQQLLSNDAGYTAHHYHFWADLLRIPTNVDYTLYYREWIKDQIRENIPYDKLAHKLVSGHGLIFDNPAAAYYLRDAGMALDNMSNSVRIFLGTRLECAQCHDHPFDKWTQMDYFKMAAYTYDFDVRMGVTKKSNRQQVYQDFVKRRNGAYKKAAGFEDFPHIHDESKINEWLSQHYAPGYLERNNLTKEKFREAAMNGLAARKKASDFDNPVSQTVNMLYGHISNVQVQHHQNKPLKLPHDYQYDNGSPHDIVQPGTMFGPEIPYLEDQTERKNAYANWLTSSKNPRFTRVIVNRIWKRTFGHGLFEPVDNLTDRTEISHPELLDFLESLMQDLDFNLRAFQNVLFHTQLFRREMHLEDHSAGMKFFFTGPLLKRMSAEQIWDSLTTLILPNVDTYTPNRKRTLERIARTKAIYHSLEGRPIEEVLPRIREAGALRRSIRSEQESYEKQISSAYAQSNHELAKQLTSELKQKVRNMEDRNRELVFVDLKNNQAVPSMMMTSSMMTSPMSEDTTLINEKISKARPRKAPDGLDPKERKKWDDKERLALRHFREIVRLMARAVELESPAKRGHFLRDFGQSDREVIENASSHASVPQALYMLNSPLDIAIHNVNSVLGRQLNNLESIEDKIDLIYRSMLTRKPTSQEVERILSEYETHGDETTEDLVWALLNSRQFIFIQ
tara:strand:+ start:1810 stop:4458 length:2649 start_codon:yes stop_codon:yes gene_type:complete